MTELKVKRLKTHFQSLIDAVPYSFSAFQEKSIYLDPRWSGSLQEKLTFVRNAAASAPKNSAVPLIVPQAHSGLSVMYPDKQQYYNRPDVWHDIETNFERIIENFPCSGVYPLWYAEIAKDAGRYELAREYYNLALRIEPNNPKIKNRAWEFQQ